MVWCIIFDVVCAMTYVDLTRYPLPNETATKIVMFICIIAHTVLMFVADHKEEKLKNRITALEKKLSDKED